MTGLDTPMTPLKFLERSAEVHPNKTAVVDGGRRISYSDLASIVTRLAHGLRRSGVGPGDRVAYLATNSAELLAAHYASHLSARYWSQSTRDCRHQKSSTYVTTLRLFFSSANPSSSNSCRIRRC